MIGTISLPIQHLLTEVIRSDPYLAQELVPLEGKVIVWNPKQGKNIYIRFVRGGAECFTRFPGDPDLIIECSFLEGLSMFLAIKLNKSVNSQVPMHGDLNIAHTLQKIFASASINMQEVLKPLMGVKAAEAISYAVDISKEHNKQMLANVQYMIKDYLLYESNNLVPAWEIEDFTNRVDELRYAVDRVRNKVKLLERKIDAKTTKVV